jgi:hypothetical protein
MVQDPGGDRPGVAVVLRGKKGTGKGVYATGFGTLFGPHFIHLVQQGQVIGKFNNHLKDALLVFADEAFWGGDVQAAGTLQALITEKTIQIEPKGLNAFSVRNHVNLLMASNASWVVPASTDERRYFVLDVSDKHMGDTQYFSKIINQMKNGGLEAMLYDLLHHEIDVDLRKIPRTEALLDQIILGLDDVSKYWFGRLWDGELISGWPEWVETKELHNQFKEIMKAIGKSHFLADKPVFIKDLKRICSIRYSRPRPKNQGDERKPRPAGGYQIPDLETCRTEFEKAVGMVIEWPPDETE